MNTRIVPLLHPTLPRIEEREELSHYFRRGDAILNDLRANHVDFVIEDEEIAEEQTTPTPSSMAGKDCFEQTLSNLVQYLEELRVEGARNPFEEDSPLQQEISEATKQFLNTNTKSTPLSGVPSCVIKPIAVRAEDMLEQRRTILY